MKLAKETEMIGAVYDLHFLQNPMNPSILVHFCLHLLFVFKAKTGNDTARSAQGTGPGKSVCEF
jgi:hypothetical protein